MSKYIYIFFFPIMYATLRCYYRVWACVHYADTAIYVPVVKRSLMQLRESKKVFSIPEFKLNFFLDSTITTIVKYNTFFF